MKIIYDLVVSNLNKHIPEYNFKLDMFDNKAYIYVRDGKETIYVIDINGVVNATKITNPNKLYRICLIILEVKVGV